MLFFGETNGLIKGSSIEVLEDRVKIMVIVPVPVLAGEHAHNKHVGEDRNEDFGEDRNKDFGKDLVELLMC